MTGVCLTISYPRSGAKVPLALFYTRLSYFLAEIGLFFGPSLLSFGPIKPLTLFLRMCMLKYKNLKKLYHPQAHCAMQSVTYEIEFLKVNIFTVSAYIVKEKNFHFIC